jgi:hypothetical protein
MRLPDDILTTDKKARILNRLILFNYLDKYFSTSFLPQSGESSSAVL